jgi:hypothetical protein
MKYSPYTDLNREITRYPPRVFLQALSGRGEAWTANPEEIARAEWLWTKRPATRLHDWVHEHSFTAFGLFTLSTLLIIPWAHVMLWLLAFATYPLFLFRSSRKIARWEECYRCSLWRIVLR